MTPSKAIGNLNQLQKQLDDLRRNLDLEIDDIAGQWAGLCRIGGQRDDHAATLLSRLRAHLAGAAKFCTEVESQLTGYVADPFGTA